MTFESHRFASIEDASDLWPTYLVPLSFISNMTASSNLNINKLFPTAISAICYNNFRNNNMSLHVYVPPKGIVIIRSMYLTNENIYAM